MNFNWELLISNVITVIISILGWIIAYRQLNKQYLKNMQLEKEKYKYELKQKIAFEVIEKCAEYSKAISRLKSLMDTAYDNIDCFHEDFFRMNLRNSFDECKISYNQLYIQLFGKKLLLKDLNSLFTELIKLNSIISIVYREVDYHVYNDKGVEVDNIQEKCKLISSTIYSLNEINNKISELLQQKFIIDIFE